MTNAEWMIKNGYKFYDLYYGLNGNGYDIFINNNCIGMIKTNVAPLCGMLKWLDMEHKEPILNDAEKKYLSEVIKPFRDRVRCIKKCQSDEFGEYIIICVKDEHIDFPYFASGTMYKGMEPNKIYTLEELGL